MRTMIIAVALVCCLIGMSGAAFAAVPQTISYQGYLTDTSGTPMNGTISITFRLYTSATGTAAPLWEETQPAAQATKGIYSVALGSVTPIALTFDTQYYLGTKVGEDPEMLPRQALSASGYAFRAMSVQTVACIPGDFLNCYSGPKTTLNIGLCKAGTRSCEETSTFGACVGEVTPAAQDACNGTDGNCDGTVNVNDLLSVINNWGA